MNSPSTKPRRLRKWSLCLAACVALAIIGSIALLYFRPHDMVYHPRAFTEDVAQSLLPGGD